MLSGILFPVEPYPLGSPEAERTVALRSNMVSGGCIPVILRAFKACGTALCAGGQSRLRSHFYVPTLKGFLCPVGCMPLFARIVQSCAAICKDVLLSNWVIADKILCGSCAGTGIMRVLATTIQQLFLLLLNAVTAPPSPVAEHSAVPMASATAVAAAATGSVESMSIVPASPSKAQQGMDVRHSPPSVTMDAMPTGSASTTSDQAATGESSGLCSRCCHRARIRSVIYRNMYSSRMPLLSHRVLCFGWQVAAGALQAAP